MLLPNKFLSNLKKNNYLILILIFCIIFVNLGTNDIEDYTRGTFSATFLFDNFPKNYFNFFYDKNGPGIKLPLAQFPYYHPLNFLLFDLKIYYFLFILLHLIIQFKFTEKLLKKNFIDYNKNLLFFALTLSLTNLSYTFANDWISCFFSFSFFPLIFYYFRKILFNKTKFITFIKFSLYFSLWILNGHLGHISVYIIFLIIYLFFILLNRKINTINLKFSLISFFLIILTTFSDVHYLYNELVKFDGFKAFVGTFSIRNYFEILIPIKKFLTYKIDRLPGNPILIFAAFSFLFLNLYSFFKKKLLNKNLYLFEKIKLIFFEVKCNEIYFFYFSFIIFIIFSLLPFLLIIPSVSAGYIARDIMIYSAIFIYFYSLKKINSNLRYLLNILLLIYSLFYFSVLIQNVKKIENNFIVNKIQKSDLVKSLKDLKLKKNDLNRIYLSPEVFLKIDKNYKSDGIFGATDLIKYNLSPFNGNFKFNSFKSLGYETRKMRGNIQSEIKLINNNFFLNIFDINFILIKYSEKELIFNDNLKLLKEINTTQGKLLLYERENKINYLISEKNLYLLKKIFSLCDIVKYKNQRWSGTYSELECLLRNQKMFEQSSHEIERQSNARYKLKTNISDTDDYKILPFLYDKNWNSENLNLHKLGNILLLAKVKDNKKNIELLIYYKNNFRLYLKIISIISIFFHILIILENALRKKFIKNPNYLPS